MKICKNFVGIVWLRSMAAVFDGVARKLKANGDNLDAVFYADVAKSLSRLADIEEEVKAFPKQLPTSMDEWSDFARNAVAFVRELQTTREVEK